MKLFHMLYFFIVPIVTCFRFLWLFICEWRMMGSNSNLPSISSFFHSNFEFSILPLNLYFTIMRMKSDIKIKSYNCRDQFTHTSTIFYITNNSHSSKYIIHTPQNYFLDIKIKSYKCWGQFTRILTNCYITNNSHPQKYTIHTPQNYFFPYT